MSHNDQIKDTETHFIIDPSTRAITNASAGNNIIVQYDHNSERFTFEMPRYVDGHDMLESTAVRINYRNASSNNLSKTNGVYLPDDLAISEADENTLTFSWLLSSAATQFIGYLHFSIQFLCHDDDGETVIYRWNTGIYKDITVIESIDNLEEISGNPNDALVAYKNEIVTEVMTISANAVKAKAIGAKVTIKDMSPNTHSLRVQLRSDTITDFKGVTLKRYGATEDELLETYTANADGTVDGVTSIYPTMTLEAGDGATVEVVYNRDLQVAMDGKLDKVTDTYWCPRAYAVDTDGTQKLVDYAVAPNAYSLAWRASGGTIAVGTPTTPNHAATKQYVDEKISIISVDELPTENINTDSFYQYIDAGVPRIYIKNDDGSVTPNSYNGVPIEVHVIEDIIDNPIDFLDDLENPTRYVVYYVTAWKGLLVAHAGEWVLASDFIDTSVVTSISPDRPIGLLYFANGRWNVLPENKTVKQEILGAFKERVVSETSKLVLRNVHLQEHEVKVRLRSDTITDFTGVTIDCYYLYDGLEKWYLKTYTANADGTVSGVASLYPHMTIEAPSGITIDAEYIISLPGVMESKIDKVTTTYMHPRLYGVNAEGTKQNMIPYHWTAQQETLALRTTGGAVAVGTPRDGSHATPLDFADGRYVKQASPAIGIRRAYVMEHDGTHGMMEVTSAMGPREAETIVARDYMGGIIITDECIHTPYSVVNKGYVDNLIAGLVERIEALENK